MDEGTNFLSVKKGQIILILIFSLLFKANYEECMMSPPTKKARVDETRPSIIKYVGSTPKQVQSSVQECNAAGPSTFHHTLPGPSRAAPPTQGPPPMVQQVSPGPSGIQILPSDFANVSIFSSNYLIEIYKNKTFIFNLI
jgi:hypothetical protein